MLPFAVDRRQRPSTRTTCYAPRLRLRFCSIPLNFFAFSITPRQFRTRHFLLTQDAGLLKEQLVAKDDGGRTILHLAALSGDHDTLDAVLLACIDNFHKNQVQGIFSCFHVLG